MTDHTARPESWDTMKQWAARKVPDSDCILELRARVERLEQAQQQPAPSTPSGSAASSAVASGVEESSTPAGQGELVGCVKKAMEAIPYEPGGYAPEARAAILAVILWLESQAWRGAAEALRREVGR